MAIRKRGDSWQIDYLDPTGKRVRKSFKKKKDAVAELGKRVSLIAEDRYLDVKKDYKTTFKELLEKYRENYGSQSSFQSWKSFCLENFKTHFGEDTLLSNIRYVILETYRNQLKEKLTKNGGLRTVASVNREISCLHHLLAKAVEWDMIERNPFEKGKSLLQKENNKRLRFLNEEEIKKLLASCPKYLKWVVECALLTGMRRGEILGLKWSQIRNGFIYLQKTKTNEAREIPVSEDLERLFKEIRRDRQFTSEYVFTYVANEGRMKGSRPARKPRGPAPNPEAIQSIKRSFQAACTRAGIEDFKFHDLRHTFASQMVMRGASLKEVQEILGHKTMAMTLRYAHLSQEHKKKAVNLLSGLTASSGVADLSCHKMSHLAISPISATVQLPDNTGRDGGI
jgi:integrase